MSGHTACRPKKLCCTSDAASVLVKWLRERPVQHRSRGSQCRAAKEQLGQLSGLADQMGDVQSFATPESIEAYVPDGIVVNVPAIVGSLVLLVVLTSIAFGRLAGFEDLFDKWMDVVKERRARKVENARETLESSWQSDSNQDQDGKT